MKISAEDLQKQLQKSLTIDERDVKLHEEMFGSHPSDHVEVIKTDGEVSQGL
jgi:hypothetical protein